MKPERHLSNLLKDHWHHLKPHKLKGPILDLACGQGHNGLFLARNGFEVICCDISSESLGNVENRAKEMGVDLKVWQVDLEKNEINPLPEDTYAGILVFRYLHRPLIPCIKKALNSGGILFYETFTVEQSKFGKPHNPDFLLQPGELSGCFEGWSIIHYFEGILYDPTRAIAQIICMKS